MAAKRNMLAGLTLSTLLVLTPYFEDGGKEHHYVYLDPIGKKTWCSGETNNTLGKRIVVGKTYFTTEECRKLLIDSLNAHSAPLNKLSYELTDGQKIAFTDITYNVGITKFERSSIYAQLISRQADAACNSIMKWRYMGKKDCAIKSNKCFGIYNRRVIETKICKAKGDVSQLVSDLIDLPIGGSDE